MSDPGDEHVEKTYTSRDPQTGVPVEHLRPQYLTIATVGDYLKDHNAKLQRARYSKVTMEQYLGMIDTPEIALKYMQMYEAHPFHKEVCAGAKHHHWWKGGLEDHICEMIGIGFDIMDLYPGDFTFTKTDLIIACFLHDFSKVWTYRYITPEDRERDKSKKYKEKQVFTYADGPFTILKEEDRILLTCGKFGIVPTDVQWSAVIFAEGGFSQAMFDFGGRSTPGNTVYTKNHLATFVSILDQWSAQILGRSLI